MDQGWKDVFQDFPDGLGAAGHVDEVAAEVDASVPIPALVQGRMQQSVQAIAEQLLSGRTLSDLTTHQAQDEATIHEVFDKVLVG